jgi:peptide/nickel transport system substrate-binding protein
MKVAGPPDPGGPFGWPPDIIGPAAATAQPCLETLYRQKADGSYYPWLATSYDLSADKKTITFHLRQGVKFSDGTDFNADAVKFNFDAMIAAKMEPFWVSTQVIDTYTLQLNLSSWSNLILGSFGDGAPIASPTAFQKNGKDWADVHPIGTGPFVLDSYQPNTKATFKRNANYWGKDAQGNQLPYLDGIEIDYIMDPMTLLAAMKSGALDMTNISLGQQQLDFQAAGFQTSVNPMTTYVLVPDTANPDSPFANLKVRQAVEYAIDREGIASGIGKGTWMAPYQIPAPSNGAWDPNFTGGLKYDPAKAKELLAEAGYPNGFDTAIISQPAARQSDVEAAIQANLNAVGIRTQLKDVDQGTFANYQANGWQNAMLISPIAAFGNYNQTLQFYFTSVASQFKSWKQDDQFTALLNASLAADTPDISLIRAVTNYMTSNSLVIPVSESGLGFAYASYVKNGGFNERGFPTNWNMESVWLDK